VSLYCDSGWKRWRQWRRKPGCTTSVTIYTSRTEWH